MVSSTLSGLFSAERQARLQSKKLSFSLAFKGEISSLPINSIFVLPGEKIVLEAKSNKPVHFEAQGGRLAFISKNRWEWEAPSPAGIYPARMAGGQPEESMTINLVVMVPYAELKDGRINGYLIGEYPSEPFRGLPNYLPPAGFIEITPDNQDLPLTPHFKLKQFVCKQAGDFPKYIVLKERLLLKLELILEKMNAAGYHAGTFNILSGYRTPAYNRAIGNVKYSRHQWGDAADIFIDEEPADDMMDDLNGDGRHDYRDAEVMCNIIETASVDSSYVRYRGGLGRYRKSKAHGPFVHIDVRGYRARWAN
jgi:hypothetical protein